jgi:hypothetical protein
MKHFFSFKALRLSSALAFLMMLAFAANSQTTLAYWAQNNNDLPGGSFGFTPSSFPQAADVGAGSLTLQNFDMTLNAAGAYTYIQSFGGSTINAEAGFPAGGSLSPQGGAALSNNGMSIQLNVSTLGYENIVLSWACQRTATGFDTVKVSYAANGIDFVNFSSIAVPSSYALRSVNLSSIPGLNNNPNAAFRFTLSGASNATGNNRYDNIRVAGTAIVTPPDDDCEITGISFAAISPCDDNGTPDASDDFFTANITVNYLNRPANDTLFLVSGNTVLGTVDVSNLPTNGQYTFFNRVLPANGMSVPISAFFDGVPAGQDCSASTELPGVAPCSISVPLCNPVINEVDYDNPGTDDREFIELYNPCDEAINLSGYSIVLVNGASGGAAIYNTLNLPDFNLQPGGFFVICGNAGTVPNCNFVVSPATNLIQNGNPDAIGLHFGTLLVDALSYGGSVPGYTEGSGAGLTDIAAANIGIGRFPDGFDTNQNNTDFIRMCITPGMPNTDAVEFCSLPAGYTVSEIGCQGFASAEYDNLTGAFTIGSSCYNYVLPNADRQLFVHQEACGNFEISARIASVLPGNGYAGIMVRESTAPNSRMISIIRFPSGQKMVMYRTMTNGAYQFAAFPSTQFSNYVRILRQGNLFLCYASMTGAPNSWQLIFAQNIAMSSCVQAGLTVSSYAEGAITLATFDNVYIGNIIPLMVIPADVVDGVQGKQSGVVQGKGELPVFPSVEEAASFVLYPNPAANELTIAFGQENRASEAEIRILSLDGKLLYRAVHNIEGSTVNLQLQSLQLAAGMYLISVNDGAAVRTERFMKVNP